jgi:hypothetical protein
MKTYSFLEVQAALVGPGGVIPLGNGAGVSDEGISVDPTAEVDTMVIGADGEGMHSLHADKSGKITVRLLKTSPTNGLLSAMLAFQRSSAATHGQNTITIVDMARGETTTCQQVAFTKQPAVTYGKEAQLVEWDFNAIKIDVALGI